MPGRYDALDPDEKGKKLTAAMAELRQGRHAEILLTCPEFFRHRMAENKVRRALARDLPSFEDWCAERRGIAVGSHS